VLDYRGEIYILHVMSLFLNVCLLSIDQHISLECQVVLLTSIGIGPNITG